LIATQTYEHLVNRMLVICGMKSGVTAISQRASALSRLGDYITGAVTEERQQFTFDHASRIEQLRELAVLVKREQTLINENKEQLAGFETVVRERMKEIEILQAELKKQRADTAEAMKKLREMSQEVLDSRLKIRDAILANENGERRIREMEKQIRELKAKKN
jgi:chromosome segregation ATPase